MPPAAMPAFRGRPIAGVFFDLYRTLLVVDDAQALRRDWLAALRAALEAEGHAVASDLLATRFRDFFARPEPPVGHAPATVLERRLARLSTELGLGLAADAPTRLAEAVVAAWGRHFRPDDEAVALLRRLEPRVALALVSNFDHPAHLRQALVAHGLAPFFAAVAISGELGVRKPDPAIFTPALEATGLRPEAVLYLGDAPEDVAGARAAGIQPVLIDRAGDRSAPAGVPRIRRLSALSELLD